MATEQNNLGAGLDHLLDETTSVLNQEPADLGGATVTTEPLIPPVIETPTQEPTEKPVTNVIYEFLQNKGIEDPSKIKFETEEGETEDVDFNTLSPEEQLTLLNEITDPGLSEKEISTINYLRSNNSTLEEVVEYFKQKAIEEYLAENPDDMKQIAYSVDEYTDEEIYLADLKSRFPTMSDENLKAKLESSQANEELFKEEVSILRQSYKEQEDVNRQLQERQQEEQYENLKNTLIDASMQFDEISLDYTDKESDTLVIEENDREQMLSYLLTPDPEGRTQFAKDINDPEKLIELAWFMTQGHDVISGISKYWKDTLKTERKELNKLKKDIEKKTNVTTQQAAVVVPTKPTVDNNENNNNNQFNIGSIWDKSNLL